MENRKHSFLFLLLVFLIMGSVLGCAKSEGVAIKIGKLTITQKEFEEAWKNSRFSQSPESREAYLDSLISKKLILMEAERKGLDKDPAFLQDIQMFWEQGLLKLAIEEKTKEISGTIVVEEKEMRDYFSKFKETYFAGKDFNQAKEHIQWLLVQEKQNQAMSVWVEELRKQTPVNVNYKELGIVPKQ